MCTKILFTLGEREDLGLTVFCCFQQGHEPRMMYPPYDNASLGTKMNRGGMLESNKTPQRLLEVFTRMTQRTHAAAQRGLQGEMFETLWVKDTPVRAYIFAKRSEACIRCESMA